MGACDSRRPTNWEQEQEQATYNHDGQVLGLKEDWRRKVLEDVARLARGDLGSYFVDPGICRAVVGVERCGVG